MRAWLFQDPRQKVKHGDKCPWSVGWIDPDGNRRGKRIGSKSMAEKFRRKTEGQLANGLIQARKRTRWDDFRKEYEESLSTGKATGTISEYKRSLSHFESLIKPKYMDAITSKSIDDFVRKRFAARPDISPATVNKDLRGIKVALRKAKKWKMIPEVPEFEMIREPERDPEFVDDEAFGKLYDACESMTRPADQHYEPADWWRGVITFAAMTGWRIGEILELRKDDVDFNQGIAFVSADKTKGRRDLA